MIALAEPLHLPKPVRCLFVGGPRDGQEWFLREVRPYWEAAAWPGFRAWDFSDRLLVPPRLEKITYRAFTFTCGPDGPDFVFYAVEPMQPADVMRRLWNRYASNATPTPTAGDAP